jgi:tRNA pseudouridine55 synthase
MEKRIDGILLIDKEEGESSFGVVKKIRRCLKQRKVGHAGTLDPFATGLLTVLLGQGTKISRFIMAGRKTYETIVRLGVETDTYDSTGKVKYTNRVPDIGFEYVEEIIQNFTGTIKQVPPVYSAVRYNGKRAYELARKGEVFELIPRKVHINSIEILSLKIPDITLRISCSSGTYVRSLGHDIGQALGVGGHLIYLRRLASGNFSVMNAIKSDEIRQNYSTYILANKIIPLCDALPDMIDIKIDGQIANKIRRGYQPVRKELRGVESLVEQGTEYFKLSIGSDLVAIANILNDGGSKNDRIKIERVFFDNCS